ncbi:hypothetical protein JCM6882_002134 [Rhodosporidiobolus microsporus]
MDKLPVELLQRIAGHLKSSIDVATLSSLSKTCRTLHAVAEPLMHRDLWLTNTDRSRKWADTYLARITPWTVASKEWKVRIHEAGVRTISLRQDDEVDFLPVVPDLRPAIVSGLFSFLTNFSIIHAWIHPQQLAQIVAPMSSFRTQLRSLVLYDCMNPPHYFSHPPVMFFALEALEYLDLEAHAGALDVDAEELARADYRWDPENAIQRIYPKCEFDFRTPTRSELDEARHSYPAFLSLFILEAAAEDDFQHSLLAAEVLTQTPARLAPWTALKTLVMQYAHEEEIYLIFHTTAFPSLTFLSFMNASDREFWCEGSDLYTFRRSITHEKPGCIEVPRVAHEIDAEPSYEDAFEYNWTPLTPQELQKYPFEAYRGPSLDTLDFEAMVFMMDRS